MKTSYLESARQSGFLAPKSCAAPRFEALCDIFDQWLVWDKHESCPASFAGEILIGLMHNSACRLADVMNDVYGNRPSDAVSRA